jgi:sec-independent protein translocase protein TatC
MNKNQKIKKEKTKTETSHIDEKLPLTTHLEELRSRLIKMITCVGVVFCFCYWQADKIFNFISAPLYALLPKSSTMTMLKLTEGFVTEFKLAFLSAIFFSMPFLLYHIWQFIVPGLYPNEKKYLGSFIIFSSILFFLGAAFAYYIVFPFGFKFFLTYVNDKVAATLSISWYLTFVTQMMLAFGLVFELPVFTLFLAKLGLVTSEMLRKYRRYAIVIIFIVAAILTPPDAISQCLMAIPLLILYEVSIYVAKAFGKKKVTDENTD